MGVDFISGKAQAYKKAFDHEAAALACPDLFRQQPVPEARQVQGNLVLGESVELGETLTVRLIDGAMFAYRREAIVAEFPSPPREVVRALRDACDVASATVEQIGLFGGTIRASLK
jgi:hypothetical protein